MASVVDPARAALITKAYRYAIQADASIKAKFANAREIVIETNLDEAGATALATSLRDQTNTFARTFTLQIEDVLYLEDFTTGSPRYTVSFSRHPSAGSGNFTVVAAKIDYGAGRTTLTVRG